MHAYLISTAVTPISSSDNAHEIILLTSTHFSHIFPAIAIVFPAYSRPNAYIYIPHKFYYEATVLRKTKASYSSLFLISDACTAIFVSIPIILCISTTTIHMLASLPGTFILDCLPFTVASCFTLISVSENLCFFYAGYFATI